MTTLEIMLKELDKKAEWTDKDVSGLIEVAKEEGREEEYQRIKYCLKKQGINPTINLNNL